MGFKVTLPAGQNGSIFTLATPRVDTNAAVEKPQVAQTNSTNVQANQAKPEVQTQTQINSDNIFRYDPAFNTYYSANIINVSNVIPQSTQGKSNQTGSSSSETTNTTNKASQNKVSSPFGTLRITPNDESTRVNQESSSSTVNIFNTEANDISNNQVAVSAVASNYVDEEYTDTDTDDDEDALSTENGEEEESNATNNNGEVSTSAPRNTLSLRRNVTSGSSGTTYPGSARNIELSSQMYSGEVVGSLPTAPRSDYEIRRDTEREITSTIEKGNVLGQVITGYNDTVQTSSYNLRALAAPNAYATTSIATNRHLLYIDSTTKNIDTSASIYNIEEETPVDELSLYELDSSINKHFDSSVVENIK